MENLEKVFKSVIDLESIQFENTALAQNKSAKDLFCENWETVKKVLQALEDLIKNKVIKIIISIVITIGDKAKDTFCK